MAGLVLPGNADGARQAAVVLVWILTMSTKPTFFVLFITIITVSPCFLAVTRWKVGRPIPPLQYQITAEPVNGLLEIAVDNFILDH